ncbi:RNA-directed DNA polymerase, eukaryota, reverse transcriptase zinc-binding domain protein [Tanacetum coccineum]
MLVIKIFSERKKVFRERKKCEKIRAKRSNIQQGMEQGQLVRGEVISENVGEEVLNDEGIYKEKCVNVDGNGNDFEPVLNAEDNEGVFGTDVHKWKNGCYMFKFRDEMGMNAVLEKGPWTVRNKSLFVQKWSSEIGMNKVEPKKLPCAMASSLGKPILMDNMTATMCHKGTENISYARVLVEIDSEKKLKNEIEIQYVDKCKNVKGNKKFKLLMIGNHLSVPIAKSGNYANAKNNQYSKKQSNGFGRMDKPKNRKKEYKKKQANADANVKSKEENKWKVGENVVDEIRKSSNKYSVLDSLPEDNDQELIMLKGRMIIDKYSNEKVQPTLH